MSTPLKLVDFKETLTSVATATWTRLLTANDRDHILMYWDGTNTIRVYYKGNNDTVPTLATDGVQYDTNFKGEFWDRGAVPVTEVWVYQATGGNINIWAREGFASEQDRSR